MLKRLLMACLGLAAGAAAALAAATSPVQIGPTWTYLGLGPMEIAADAGAAAYAVGAQPAPSAAGTAIPAAGAVLKTRQAVWAKSTGSGAVAVLASPLAANGPAYVPLGSQHGLSLSSAAALTVPDGADYAVACARGAAANYTLDGVTPTAGLGTPLAAGACAPLYGAAVIAGFQAYGAGATLDVEYFR